MTLSGTSRINTFWMYAVIMWHQINNCVVAPYPGVLGCCSIIHFYNKGVRNSCSSDDLPVIFARCSLWHHIRGCLCGARGESVGFSAVSYLKTRSSKGQDVSHQHILMNINYVWRLKLCARGEGEFYNSQALLPVAFAFLMSCRAWEDLRTWRLLAVQRRWSRSYPASGFLYECFSLSGSRDTVMVSFCWRSCNGDVTEIGFMCDIYVTFWRVICPLDVWAAVWYHTHLVWIISV